MKIAILLMAWGAGTIEARARLGSFESLCRGCFPGLTIRWAYTSDLARERLSSQRRKSDSAKKALMRLYFEKYDAVCVQPLQVIAGREHEAVKKTLLSVESETGMICESGDALLASSVPPLIVAKALVEHVPEERKATQSVVFMGHGARQEGSLHYMRLSEEIRNLDANIHIGAMHGELELANLLAKLHSGRVWLMPLLATFGKHTIEDMAGYKADSWMSRIEDAGFECKPVLKSLAESPRISRIWLDNLSHAMRKIASRVA